MANNKIIDLDRLSRFKDKLDIELDKKANVDGNYPTLTSGLADNLTPYSEDSGAEQTNPFISNGTGTNNNTEIVTVGDYGLFKEKQGNSVVVNQLAIIQSAYVTETINDITFTKNDDGSWTINGTASADTEKVLATVDRISNHVNLLRGCPSGGNSSTFYLKEATGHYDYGSGDIYTSGSTNTQAISFVVKNGTTITNKKVYPQFIDLTQMFNGDIPQDLLDNPSHFSWYYNGSLAYNTGSLENANGVKLVSTKRNIWDEEWEIGAYNTTTGEKDNATTSQIRCKNHILVVPNKTYYSFCGTYDGYLKPLFYDENDNYIGTVSSVYNSTFTTPSNCCYIRFYMNLTYGTTYNHDITISLYYTPEQGGEGYNQYYPYEAPYVVDTGSEVLRKAGSVKDYKEPNGTIHRLVGSYTFTGNENVLVRNTSGTTWTRIEINNVLTQQSVSELKTNIICSNGCPAGNGYSGVAYCIETNGLNIYAVVPYIDGTANDFKTLFSQGTIIYYVLKTPTTEQGTPFAENLPINDYGMLYWLDENDNLVGIPQGAKIFYPTNYKGFIDDMYSRVDGDSSKYVIQSELSASETQRDTVDTQLQNAIGGTLRQCLCVKESLDFDNTDVVDLGTLNWEYSSGYFSCYNFPTNRKVSGWGTSIKAICSKYKLGNSYGSGDSASFVDKRIYPNYASSNIIYIKDTTYTGATAFKNAMKGVLLAYEKA